MNKNQTYPLRTDNQLCIKVLETSICKEILLDVIPLPLAFLKEEYNIFKT